MLGKKSLVRPPAPLLTERLKQLRFEHSKKLLNKLEKIDPSTVQVFSNKKIFTIDQVYNRRNDRLIVDLGSPTTSVNKTKHPASVMVLGMVASDGNKCLPIFIPSGEKVNTESYIGILASKFLPMLKRMFPGGNYVLQ